MMNLKVPFLDLHASYLELQDELEECVMRSLRSGCYIGGDEVEAFESAFADFTDTEYCIGVSNGLDALRISLLALGIGAGDEVLVPSNTFIATWLAVSHTGALPVPVEPDLHTYNIETDQIEKAITPNTRAIIPVHLYGQPADMSSILRLAERKGIYVLEDAAQAHGARYMGRPVGGHGICAAWSFYPGKNLGALGDAGAITTNDRQLADRIRLLRNYGSDTRYVHKVRGFNHRLDPLQAGILKIKLRYLPEWNKRRNSIARRYCSGLEGLGMFLPEVPKWVDPVWHLFCVRHDEREWLQRRLKDVGIQTLIHYPVPPHLQLAYQDLGYGNGSLPIAESMAATLLSLPIGPTMTPEQVDYVIFQLKTILASRARPSR